MARYPGAIQRPITRFRRAMTPRRVTLHTAVTSTSSLFAFFNRPGQVCSHFYVRKDGVVEQYVDTRYAAAADLDGNPDTISIETWDGYKSGAPGYWRNDSDVPPWTPAQMRSLAALVDWCIRTHPTIPRRLATTSQRNSTSHGVAWHRLGVPTRTGNRTSQTGGMLWSRAAGKVCPGNRRIAQIPLLLTTTVGGPGWSAPTPITVPSLTAPTPLTPLEEFMSSITPETFVSLVEQAILKVVYEASGKRTQTGRNIDTWIVAYMRRLDLERVNLLLGRVDPAARQTADGIRALTTGPAPAVDTDALAAALAGPVVDALKDRGGTSLTKDDVADTIREVFGSLAVDE